MPDSPYKLATDALEAHLRAVASPSFQQVLVGEPLSIAASRTAAVWFVGESDKQQTLGNVMTWHDFQVRLYWSLANASAQVRKAIEVEAQEALRAVQARLQADNELGGACERLDLPEATTEYYNMGGTLCRTLSFVVSCSFPEAEPVSR